MSESRSEIESLIFSVRFSGWQVARSGIVQPFVDHGAKRNIFF